MEQPQPCLIHKGAPIRCRAAVAWGPNQPLSMETIDVYPPRKGEVRIRIAYTALCHSDLHAIAANISEIKSFPIVLGHEAAGVVESVGEGVEDLKEGDHVIPLWLPQCNACEYCASPKTNQCDAFYHSAIINLQPDGTTRLMCRGESLYQFIGLGTFSEYTVVAANALAKIPLNVPLDKVCLLGCGVSTGYGAALKHCKVEAGSRVAVWGLGAIGLAVVMGAKKAGAKEIIAIDLLDGKREKAERLGATGFVNPKKDVPEGKTLQEYLVEKYNGGFDYTFECVGRPETVVGINALLIPDTGTRKNFRNKPSSHPTVGGVSRACWASVKTSSLPVPSNLSQEGLGQGVCLADGRAETTCRSLLPPTWRGDTAGGVHHPQMHP